MIDLGLFIITIKIMKNLLVIVLFFLLSMNAVMAFDDGKYRNEMPASLTPEIFYPGFFKETDPITFENVFAEFKHRYEFFTGITSESTQKSCFKVQNQINRWLKKLQKRKEKIPFLWADDELLFNEESSLHYMIKPMLIKPEVECNYLSYGDISSDGGVFCLFHGPDPSSEFYQAHAHEFAEARPFITAYDLTEIIIFIPFILVVPITWLIMKKSLSSPD